jgi:hypothetical protein
MSSASKRPRPRDDDGGLPYEGTLAAPKKARDWRDEFLDDEVDRSHGRDRRRSNERYRRDNDDRSHGKDHDRHSAGRVSYDDSRRQSAHPSGHVRSRDDDRGLSYGDAAGPSRSAGRPRGRVDGGKTVDLDREEGEWVAVEPTVIAYAY